MSENLNFDNNYIILELYISILTRIYKSPSNMCDHRFNV